MVLLLTSLIFLKCLQYWGIYEQGQLLLEEPVNTQKKYKVLVTFIDEVKETDASKKRPFGILKGVLRTPDNFDDSLDDLKEYM